MTKKVTIEDLYVEDLVKGVAKKMNVLCLEEHNITKLTIPDDIGSGFLKATQFASGLGILETSYNFKEDFVIEMEKHKVNPLKFVFNLGDKFYHKFNQEATFEGIDKYSGAIIGSSIDKHHSFKIPKNKNIVIFSLELNRNLFEHKLKSFKFDLNDDLNTLLRDVKAINPFFFKYLFGAEIFELINKITTNKKKGFIGSLYKEGLTYSILSDTLETYLGEKHSEHLHNLSVEDVDTVLEISDFIEENLSELPTIDVIANNHLLSETKIQKIFKDYYNCSVHDFIRNKRLTEVRELLEKTNFSIGEIADKVGILSNSYLSKIFKERYGVSPSKYRGSRLSKVRFY
ncbi:helix-turn-helix transcriptional regulator [uncultured Polaribacter sp.]|uniref:helix-turn-helix transcriptional regulator n=1 Tax=uncultured Polaribacter sp. TaxID=174711 RepID=UPI00261AACFF|nr:helix-turn-helix transcriptional regulator [uncultured Polaribacter sp.]